MANLTRSSIIVIVAVLFGALAGLLMHLHIPDEPEPTWTCERLLMAVPNPLNGNQVYVQEMRVCGTDLEWQRIQPYDVRGKEV